ncbi:CAP family protein [Asticcacaulis tiandongensis]|uniref:CAP family protein n=1 Tax=Asticcacaulis tiandongensis TaxID=2565365 RepID=UPI00112CDF30|nr:CAP family protein [Asticcacaulis tiandongensis]
MKFTLIIALLACAFPASATDLTDQMLSVHNTERQLVGAPPLKWNAQLAQDAQVWANHLASHGLFQHSTSADGENLWMGTAGAYSYRQMAQLWADEKAKFRYAAFPDISTDGNWANVGHYTQMIWSTTTELGCAKATGKTQDILVCRYRRPGNVYGQKPY